MLRQAGVTGSCGLRRTANVSSAQMTEDSGVFWLLLELKCDSNSLEAVGEQQMSDLPTESRKLLSELSEVVSALRGLMEVSHGHVLQRQRRC